MEELETSAVAAETSADDWDDISLADVVEETAESAPEGEAGADQPEAETEGNGEPEADEKPEAEAKPDQAFELKHLDEVRTVGRDEVIELAQKGMDYDRVREKYDAAKESIEWYSKNGDSVRWLEEIAKEQGMTFEELVDSTRAQIMANRTNQSLAVCKGIVANERKALQLEAQKKAIEAKGADGDKKAKMDADLKAFQSAYPEQFKNPDGIPKEVWDAVHQGETLVNAYRAWENKQLKEQLAKEKAEAEKRKQEQKNKARSTGSQASAGKQSEMDEFDRAWYDGT